MNSRFAAVLTALCFGALWVALIVNATFNGWFRSPLTDDRSAVGFLKAAELSVPGDFRGNMIVVLIGRGRPVGQFVIGPDGAVPDGSSVYQIASLSKWVTAAGVLTLVDEGIIKLDDPVEDYLTRWSFPKSGFDSHDVTVRRLLSHTGGLTDDLGYMGFARSSDVQPLEESLTKATDAIPGVAGRVEIGRAPGKKWSYSGGGYSVLQLMVEEITRQSFSDAMREHVFHPLGMEPVSYTHLRAHET